MYVKRSFETIEFCPSVSGSDEISSKVHVGQIVRKLNYFVAMMEYKSAGKNRSKKRAIVRNEAKIITWDDAIL